MFLLLAFTAFLLSYVLTPPIRGLAWRMGAVDVPEDHRRMHCEILPRNGGLAILLPFFLGAALSGHTSPFLVRALYGGGLLMAVGLVDDIYCLSAFTKLAFQSVTALLTVLGSGFGESWGEVAWGILWVLTLTNAHNFIDGMDGLLAGCTVVEGVLLAGTLFLTGHTQAAGVSLLLAVTALGFLPYNRYPASIFAGDCGSEGIGFLFGMLSLPLFDASAPSFSALAPLFLFAYPLTDLVAAVLRRILRGKSPFAADRAHLHHRIYAAGLSVPECTVMLVTVSGFLGGIGLFLSTEALWGVAGAVCILTAGALFFCRSYLLRHARL